MMKREKKQDGKQQFGWDNSSNQWRDRLSRLSERSAVHNKSTLPDRIVLGADMRREEMRESRILREAEADARRAKALGKR